MMNLIDSFKEKARKNPVKIVFPEGDDEGVIQASALLLKEGFSRPILLGKEADIREVAGRIGVDLGETAIVDPLTSPRRDCYADLYCQVREGVSPGMSQRLLRKRLVFGAMMVSSGDVAGMVAGIASPTALVIQAASMAIGYNSGVSIPSSFFIMVLPEKEAGEERLLIYADAALNVDPDAEQLAEIAVSTARSARRLLGMEPRLAFLSFSTKGSASHQLIDKVVRAKEIASGKAPDILMDGELQADTALVPAVALKKAQGSAVAGRANILIFPDLNSANIAYKLTQYLAGAKAYGPILQGFRRPVNDLSRGATPEDIVGLTAITVVQSQEG